MVDSTGTTNWAYDPLGRMKDEMKGGAHIHYDYLPNGLLTQMLSMNPSGLVDRVYGYDAGNRLASIVENGMPIILAYDVDSQVVSRILPTGAHGDYTYSLGTISSIEHYDGFGTLYSMHNYSYQTNGRIKSVSELGGALTRFDYDFLNRLTRENRTGPISYDFLWSYDSAGNRTTQNRNGQLTSYSHDLDNRLVTVDPPGPSVSTLVWDLNGRLLEIGGSANKFRFYWSYEGTLSTLDEWNGSAWMPSRNMQSDGLNRYTHFIEHDSAGLLESFTDVYFDGASVLQRDITVPGPGGGTTSEAFTFAGGLIASQDTNTGSTRWNATDLMGSLRGWTNEFGQNGGYSAIYNAFGEAIHQNGQDSGFAFLADYGVETSFDLFVLTPDGYYNPSLALLLPQWSYQQVCPCPDQESQEKATQDKMKEYEEERKKASEELKKAGDATADANSKFDDASKLKDSAWSKVFSDPIGAYSDYCDAKKKIEEGNDLNKKAAEHNKKANEHLDKAKDAKKAAESIVP